MFAKIKGKPKAIFGLPGNPISSSACFRFFVYPYLRSLLGIREEKSFKAILKNEFRKKKGSCAQTLLNNIDVIILNKSENLVNLFVRRSFSEHLFSWINDSASRL